MITIWNKRLFSNQWVKTLFSGFLGYLLGKTIFVGNYLFIKIIPFLFLLFLPEFYFLILCFFLIQISPTVYFKIGHIGPADFFLWDPLIFIGLIRFAGPISLQKRIFSSTRLTLLIFVFFLYGLISVIFSYKYGEEHFFSTLISLLRTFYFVSIFFLTSNLIDSKDKLKVFIKVILWIMMFQVALAIAQRVGGFFNFTIITDIFSTKGAYGSIDFRSSATLGNPNLFGQAMILFSFSTFIIFYQKGNNISRLFFTIIFFTGVILSGSRAAYVGALVVISTFILQLKTKKVKNFIFIFIVFVILTSYFSAYLLHRILSEFTLFDITNRNIQFLNTSSSVVRFNQWKYKLSLLYLSPIWGHGWYGSHLVHGKLFGGMGFSSAYNQYIETLVNLGIPGFILFSIIHLYILYQTWNLRNITNNIFYTSISTSLFAAFIGFYITLIWSATLETGNPTTGIFWVIAGLAISATKIAKRENEEIVVKCYNE